MIFGTLKKIAYYQRFLSLPFRKLITMFIHFIE